MKHELVAVAEMMKRSNITPDQLHHTVESFKRGYELAQKEMKVIFNRALKTTINDIIKE